MKKVIYLSVVSLFVFGMSNLSFAMMCGGHSGSKQLGQAHTEHEHGAEETVTEATTTQAVDVGNKICPVSGENIDEQMKTTYEYQGKIYNFCCAMCVEEFKKDPEKYIEKVEEELSSQSKTETKEEEPTEMPVMEMQHHEGHQH